MTSKLFPRKVYVADSNFVESVFFHPLQNEMTVAFINGAIVKYNNIPNEVFGRLVAADSVGSELNRLKEQRILDTFEYIRHPF